MQKPTPEAIAAFDNAIPSDDERVVRKKMFGMPAGFVNGNMFLGVFADGVVFRLSKESLHELKGRDGIGAFEPMPGRPWKEYAHARAESFAGSSELAELALEALEHTAKMPAKKPKKKKA